VSCNSVHVEDEQPYRAIIDTATREGRDLIIMASLGRRRVSAIPLAARP
jgi:nucleotide-binding universal stress UspA family protein